MRSPRLHSVVNTLSAVGLFSKVHNCSLVHMDLAESQNGSTSLYFHLYSSCSIQVFTDSIHWCLSLMLWILVP